MAFYRNNIFLFGIIVPVVGAALIIAVCAIIKGRMEASFTQKQSEYRGYEQNRIAALQIESQVARQVPHLKRWEEHLSAETASAVSSNLQEIYRGLPSKEIQQTAFERPTGSGVIGNASAQKSSQVRIAMRGTFRTLQKAFLALESRMPQLQLEEIRLEPITNNTSQLNFQVTYTAWEN